MQPLFSEASLLRVADIYAILMAHLAIGELRDLGTPQVSFLQFTH